MRPHIASLLLAMAPLVIAIDTVRTEASAAESFACGVGKPNAKTGKCDCPAGTHEVTAGTKSTCATNAPYVPPPAACSGDTKLCGGKCVDPRYDPANCGGCGVTCATPAHASSMCATGKCSFTCASGYADCDVSPLDGCEVALASDAHNCGRCGVACPSGVSCVAGACGGAAASLGSANTIGESTTLASSRDITPDYLLGPSVVVPSTRTLLKLAVISLSVGTHVTLALYADDGGSPGRLVAATASTTMISGRMEIPIAAPTLLLPGTYWLMADYDAHVNIAADAENSTIPIKYQSLTYGTPLPISFGAAEGYNGGRFNYYLVVK